MTLVDLDTIQTLRDTGKAQPVPALSCVLTSRAAAYEDTRGLRVPNAWQFTCDILGQTVLCYTRNPHVAELVNRIKLRDKISLCGEAFGGAGEWTKHPLFVETMARLRTV